MEYGDKVICIEAYTFCGNKYNIKNETYIVVSSPNIGRNMIAVSCEDEGHCAFSVSEFRTHFLTIKEERKLKLNKIDKCIKM
jgi:hypothetical protein